MVFHCSVLLLFSSRILFEFKGEEKHPHLFDMHENTCISSKLNPTCKSPKKVVGRRPLSNKKWENHYPNFMVVVCPY